MKLNRIKTIMLTLFLSSRKMRERPRELSRIRELLTQHQRVSRFKKLKNIYHERFVISKAAYAKSASRYWENNAQTPAGCTDLALQLVHGEIGKKLDVILGGGFREFLPNNTFDMHGRRGRRTDNRDLIREWMFSHRRGFFAHNRVITT